MRPDTRRPEIIEGGFKVKADDDASELDRKEPLFGPVVNALVFMIVLAALFIGRIVFLMLMANRI